jgi:GH15 family glucan-1,4-alpha-glucosidase
MAPARPHTALAPTVTSAGDRYPPIGDYAVIGDGRTVALIGRGGSIDWLCLPDVDSGSVFAALLDAEHGGAFRLAPVEPHAVERRYLPQTNVLETTFTTSEGTVRVSDAMLLPLVGLAPTRELARRVEGVNGRVRMRWQVEPRFGYGQARTRIVQRPDATIASAGQDALAVVAFDAGEAELSPDSINGEFAVEAGSASLLALSVARGEPLIFPGRHEVERRFEATVRYWRGWATTRRYTGPWRDAVVRSALALKLLIYAPSGAIAAAATTSLPETLGGTRNWDYRYSWIRDSSATLDALLRLGCPGEGEAFFWWLLHASQLTHPRLNVLYRLDGRARVPERELPLNGYAGSRPVRVGNAAATQLQLDVYGHLLQTAWLYVEAGGRLDADAAARMAETADLVAELWRSEDSGVWEVRSRPQHFTQSKMMSWIALDRACRLAEGGQLSGAHAARWRTEADAVRRFVREQCWSEKRRSYARSPGSSETDASLLLPILLGYAANGSGDDETERLKASVERIRAELGTGALVYRYRGEDGLPGSEGTFLACSFWLVDALAQLGETDQAAELMEELVRLANDVGLYAEEIDPESGAFLGNFPQGLVHLALINAAVTLEQAEKR